MLRMGASMKGYDLYIGAKSPKGYDYSTRYDYSASAGNGTGDRVPLRADMLSVFVIVLPLDP